MATAPSPSMCATCTMTVGTTRMRNGVPCGHVNHGSSAARTTSVWPRRGSVMGTTTVGMGLMNSPVVSRLCGAFHFLFFEDLSLTIYFLFLTFVVVASVNVLILSLSFCLFCFVFCLPFFSVSPALSLSCSHSISPSLFLSCLLAFSHSWSPPRTVQKADNIGKAAQPLKLLAD